MNVDLGRPKFVNPIRMHVDNIDRIYQRSDSLLVTFPRIKLELSRFYLVKIRQFCDLRITAIALPQTLQDLVE